MSTTTDNGFKNGSIDRMFNKNSGDSGSITNYNLQPLIQNPKIYPKAHFQYI